MSEAERLADALDSESVTGRVSNHTGRKAAAELRRLSAELAALKAAVFTVVEGFTLPHDVRKILESALYAIPKDKP